MNKGFITIYGIILLNVALSFSSMIIIRVRISSLYHNQSKLDFAEIYTIKKVTSDLIDYQEKKEDFEYEGYQISLNYEDITCFIKISKDNKLLIHSKLEFDDLDEVVTGYSYLEKQIY